MTEEARIIIKNRLIKSAKKIFTEESASRNKANKMTFILGARNLLLLLYQEKVLDTISPLFEDLDLNNVKLQKNLVK